MTFVCVCRALSYYILSFAQNPKLIVIYSGMKPDQRGHCVELSSCMSLSFASPKSYFTYGLVCMHASFRVIVGRFTDADSSLQMRVVKKPALKQFHNRQMQGGKKLLPSAMSEFIKTYLTLWFLICPMGAMQL